MRFLFLSNFLSKKAAGPSPNPASTDHLAPAIILFLLVSFSECKGREPDRRSAH
jgi:hypothetical protein